MQTAGIKVLIVEDEPLILKNIIKHIRETDADFEVVDTAINGQEALEKVYMLRPDVVFTDIRMPVMDGITLIRNIRISFKELPIVILSGYSDFEYMQQSIDLSVTSYLLKPLESNQVNEVLSKLKDSILVKRNRIKKEILTSKINRDGCEAALPYANGDETFMLILINIGNLTNSLLSVQNSECFQKIWKAISWEYLIRSVIPVDCEWWVVDENLTNRKFLLLAGAEEIRISMYVRRLLEEVEKYAVEFPVNIAYHKKQVAYQDIEVYANSLRILMEEKLVLCTSKSFCKESPSADNTWSFKEKELNAILQKKDAQILNEYLIMLGKSWEKAALPQRNVENLQQKIVECLDKQGLFSPGRNAAHVIRKMQEQASLATDSIHYYATVWGIVLESGFKLKGTTEQAEEIVLNIKAYIEQHYTEDINLSDMAEEFHFTAAYLTKIFKKYIHETPLKFMINLRMDKAKAMLRQHPELSVQAISDIVGYEESHYFCRIFKSNVGMTPTEYRELDRIRNLGCQ